MYPGRTKSRNMKIYQNKPNDNEEGTSFEMIDLNNF